MTTEYADYTRDRVGWFFGMTGPQLATVTVAGLPLLLAVGVQQWALVALCLLGWVCALMLVLIPVRGRAATPWLGTLVTHTVGRVAGWSAFRGKVSVGETPDPDDADLPGILSALQVHDGLIDTDGHGRPLRFDQYSADPFHYLHVRLTVNERIAAFAAQSSTPMLPTER